MSIFTAALNLAEAKAAAQKLAANIAKRSARLQKLELITNAVVDFEKLKQSGVPKTVADWTARGKELEKLNQNPGLRVSTAPQVAQKEAKAQTRQNRRDLAERSKDGVAKNAMTKRQLQDVLNFRLSSLKAKRAGVMKGFGETHAVTLFDEKLKELAGKGKIEGLSRQQLSYFVTQLNKIDSYEGMTVAGARVQQARGIEWFGADYADWTPKEAAAVWDKVHEIMAADRSLGSTVAQDMVKQYIEDENISVAFTWLDGKGHKLDRPTVAFGFTAEEAQVKAAKTAALDREYEKHKESSISVLNDHGRDDTLKLF